MGHWEDAHLRAFRAEVRAFCDNAVPASVRRKVETHALLEKQDIVDWQNRLQERGWLLGHWPKRYGGADWSLLQRYVFLDETANAGAPRIAPFGVNYCGPVLYTFGTKEQCDRYLPGIADSTTWWCQGYSEPGAGSDLAALSTRAVRDGDSYRVTGQKVWTTFAHWADMMFCLVRTSTHDKPQEGISFLLIDMKSPGVTVRPIITMDLCHETNEVFLDDVVVPAENLIGIEGKGWTYAKFLLDNERISVSYFVGRVKLMLDRLRRLAETTYEAGRPCAADPEFKRSYADLGVSVRVLESLCARQLAFTGQDESVRSVGASILKLRCTELSQKIAQAQVDLMARQGLPYRPELLTFDGESEPHAALWEAGIVRGHLIGRASTIYGGSSEIQKNVVAKALGL